MPTNRGRGCMATREERLDRAADAQLTTARAAGRARRTRGEIAIAIRYVPQSNCFRILLASGVTLSIPRHLIQGLEHAPLKDARRVELAGRGYGLHWPTLDVDIAIPDLLAGSFGTKAWMSALARVAGRTKSAAKASAARENGRKGGRPRKRDRRSEVFLQN